MRERASFVGALLALLIGAAAALLISSRDWQQAVLARQRPLPDDVLDVTGRTVDAAPTAFALVALAGVVAVLATRGSVRRVVGAVLVVTGIVVVWRSLAGLSALGATRVRSLDAAAHSGVEVDQSQAPHVSVHAVWPWLSAISGLLILAAGLVVLARGHRFAGLSTRYDSAAAPTPADDVDAARRGDVALWNALDRGADPTATSTDDGERPAPTDGGRGGADTLG